MTFRDRYFWLLWHAIRIFGIMMRIVVVFLGFFVLTDLFRLTSFGYPDWTILFCAAFYVVGHYITRVTRMALSRRHFPIPD